MGKRVLITGANGFVGSNLMSMLADTDIEIIPMVRKSINFKNEVIVDFCDLNFCKIVYSLPKVDAVIHLGAKVSFDVNSKNKFFVPNVLATGILANWAQKTGVYFVYTSTAIVCGVNNPHITVDSKLNPDTDYSYSKWLSEELIKMSGVKHVILRVGGIFGKNGPHHLGINKAIDNGFKGIVPNVLSSCGEKRNYIYVYDLAKLIAFCLKNEIEGIHMVAGSEIYTIHEMLETICNRLLHGKELMVPEGKAGNDQIIETSSILPRGMSFEEAIEHIIISS
ncbi:MAG: NAD(P)-dependent oxidoreductase [Candidatus Brocadiaceae bacterium]|nr:NAD(P)-dependent oxidoreductase [Candidatus Brocadiaceae bacterium]